MGVPQYKSCWKWGYTTFVCYAYGSKYIKCNGLYKAEHYREIVWFCKANFQTNSPRLKTKKDKSCSHFFKYINCKEEHQADSNICSFWKHGFNKK